MAMSGKYMAVGGLTDTSSHDKSWPAAVQVFVRGADGVWNDTRTFDVSVLTEHASPLRVGFSEDHVLVAHDDVVEEFARTAAGWSKVGELAGVTRPKAAFESFVSAGNDWFLGAPSDGTGAVHVLRHEQGGALAAGLTLRSSRAVGSARFGGSMSATSRLLFVGEPGESQGGYVHVYDRRDDDQHPH
jgi:hypothetical protein